MTNNPSLSLYYNISMALYYLERFIYFVLFIRVFISWLPIPRNNVFCRLIYTFSEPILFPIRALIEKSPLGRGAIFVDFSPVIAMFIISFLRRALSILLYNIMV